MFRVKSIGAMGIAVVLLLGCGSKPQPPKPNPDGAVPQVYLGVNCVCSIEWTPAMQNYLALPNNTSSVTIDACLLDGYSTAGTAAEAPDFCSVTVKGYVQAEIEEIIQWKNTQNTSIVCGNPSPAFTSISCALAAIPNQDPNSPQFLGTGIKKQPSCDPVKRSVAYSPVDCHYAAGVKDGQPYNKNCDVTLNVQGDFNNNQCGCNTVHGCTASNTFTVIRSPAGNADDPGSQPASDRDQGPTSDLVGNRREGIVDSTQSSLKVTATGTFGDCPFCESVSASDSGFLSGGFRIYGNARPGTSSSVVLEADLKSTDLHFDFQILGQTVAYHTVTDLVIFVGSGETPVVVDASGHGVIPSGAMQYRAFWKDNGDDYENIANLQSDIDFSVDWSNRTVSISQTPLSIGAASGFFDFKGSFGTSMFEATSGLCPVPTFGAAARVSTIACSADSSVRFYPPALATACRDVITVVTGQVVSVNDVALTPPIDLVNDRANIPRGKAVVRWTVTDSRGKTATVDQTVDTISRPALAAVGKLSLGDRTKVQETSGHLAVISNTGSDGVTLGTDVLVGEVDSVGTVGLNDRATVSGAVISPAKPNVSKNGASIGSYINETPIAVPLPALPPASKATNPVVVSVGQTKPLAPGSYGAVTIYTDGKLLLSAGDYAFDSLDLEPNAHLVLNKTAGAIRVVVNKNIILRGVYDHTPSSATGFVLGYLGTDIIYVESAFRGTLVAPAGTINHRALNGGHSEGEFFGKNVTTEAGAMVVHVPAACVD